MLVIALFTGAVLTYWLARRNVVPLSKLTTNRFETGFEARCALNRDYVAVKYLANKAHPTVKWRADVLAFHIFQVNPTVATAAGGDGPQVGMDRRLIQQGHRLGDNLGLG